MAPQSPLPRARRRTGWALAVVLAAVATMAITYLAAARSRQQLPVLWMAPEFSLVDQHGARLSKAALRDHVWIANFIFTRCTSVCPTLTAKMRVLQRQLANPELRFVSFSVDPEHDSPSALRDYAEVWAKDEARWSLLHTERESLQRLSDGLRVVALPSGDGENPILHTSLFFLIDTVGRVRGLYDSNDEHALRNLISDARTLAAGPSIHEQSRGSGSGEASFDALGCASCHDDPKLAPPLAGIWGQAVSLADGTTAQVDEAYVRESISAPGARLVSGFLDLMPSYGSELSGPELDALVEHVKSLSPAVARRSLPALSPAAVTAPPATPQSEVAEDPVCGMKVRVSSQTPRASRDDHAYYFCSESCKSRFLAAPGVPHAHATNAR